MVTRKMPEGMKIDPSNPAYCDWCDNKEEFSTSTEAQSVGSDEEVIAAIREHKELFVNCCGPRQLGISKEDGHVVVQMDRLADRRAIKERLEQLARIIGKDLSVTIIDVGS